MPESPKKCRFGVAIVLACLAPCLFFPPPPAAAASCRLAPGNYAGTVRHYIADLKPSFPEHRAYSAATALTPANYRAVLDGLRNVGVDGIRVPIVPRYAEASQYPAVYRDVYDYARQLGLLVYASPMAVGMGDFAAWSDEQYVAWLAGYANAFRPDVLSPFNEAGIGDSRVRSIVAALRARLGSSVRLAGPDRQHVGRTVNDLSADPDLAGLFDIINSHSANRDSSATAGNWTTLVREAGGKPVWSSENPADWGHGNGRGVPGIGHAVAGGVSGIVIWMAKPGLVNDAGLPTKKACEIAAHLAAGN